MYRCFSRLFSGRFLTSFRHLLWLIFSGPANILLNTQLFAAANTVYMKLMLKKAA